MKNIYVAENRFVGEFYLSEKVNEDGSTRMNFDNYQKFIEFLGGDAEYAVKLRQRSKLTILADMSPETLEVFKGDLDRLGFKRYELRKK